MFLIGTTWSLQARPQQRSALLGRDVSINCLNGTTSFAQDIQWFKILNDGQLQFISHSPTERITSNAHQLQLRNTVAEDEGQYCCKAFSEIQCSPTAIANITILLPPVLSPLQNQTIQVGETISLNCTVIFGEPTTFLWQKDGKNNSKNDTNYSITHSENRTTLVVTNVTIMDKGYYKCIAKNKRNQQANESLYLQVELPLGK